MQTHFVKLASMLSRASLEKNGTTWATRKTGSDRRKSFLLRSRVLSKHSPQITTLFLSSILLYNPQLLSVQRDECESSELLTGREMSTCHAYLLDIPLHCALQSLLTKNMFLVYTCSEPFQRHLKRIPGRIDRKKHSLRRTS